MIRLIAMDLDETLLRTDKSISALSKAALMNARASGVKVVYATARGKSAAEYVQAEMFDGRVMMNGALAYKGEELIYNRLVEMDLARDLLLACDRRGLKTAAELGGMHYSNFNVTDEWSNILSYQLTDFSRHEVAAEKLYSVICDDSDIAFLREHMPKGLYLTVSRDKLAQVMHIDATKAKALKALADQWGIGMDEIAAFGDDLNDIDMLSQCGVGVAMGNALDEVKAVADEIAILATMTA